MKVTFGATAMNLPSTASAAGRRLACSNHGWVNPSCCALSIDMHPVLVAVLHAFS
jgi:hypothetical protein